MFYDTTQFPSLKYCGPHTKPHDIRGFSNHYHMRFDLKLWHFICEICRITFACAKCTYILEKPWVHGFPPQQHPHYQPVTDFTYWQLLGSFNNWNINTLSHKETTSEAFEKICQVVLDGISDNMASLVRYGKYGATNTT